MLHIEASGNVSQEDFVTRNSAIYEGIEVQNIACLLYTSFKVVQYIGKGIRCLARRKIEVPVLDATAIGVSVLRGDFNTCLLYTSNMENEKILETGKVWNSRF